MLALYLDNPLLPESAALHMSVSYQSTDSTSILLGTREPLHKLIDWCTKELVEWRMRRCGDGWATDVRIDGVEWEGQSHPARAVSGRDGRGDSVSAADCADRTALSQGRTGSPAAGTGEDAAGLLPAAVVQPLGPAGRRRDLCQRVDAPVCAGGTGRRRGAGRDHDSALSPPAGAAWADPSDLQFDHRPAGRTAAVAALGNHC